MQDPYGHTSSCQMGEGQKERFILQSCSHIVKPEHIQKEPL